MKYRIGITLACLSAVSLYAAVREPNRRYIEKISQKRRSKGIHDATAAALCTVRNTTEHEIVVAGSIIMPSEGETTGTGTGFSYIADAQAGTVIITFNELTSPTVHASAHDIDAKRAVSITIHSETTVALHIENFTPGNPTVVEFNAIQFEKA